MIGNNNIERKSSIKFLGVMLDEHISWTVENKIAENIYKTIYNKNIYKNIKLHISRILIPIWIM